MNKFISGVLVGFVCVFIGQAIHTKLSSSIIHDDQYEAMTLDANDVIFAPSDGIGHYEIETVKDIIGHTLVEDMQSGEFLEDNPEIEWYIIMYTNPVSHGKESKFVRRTP